MWTSLVRLVCICTLKFMTSFRTTCPALYPWSVVFLVTSRRWFSRRAPPSYIMSTQQIHDCRDFRAVMRRALRSYRLIMAETDRPSPFSETNQSSVPLNGSKSLLDRLFGWLPSWRPSSEVQLEEAERTVMKELKSEYRDYFVPISEDALIRTIAMDPENEIPQAATSERSEQTPVVMVHGFGAGFLQFYKNLDYLHSDRKLLAIDLPGFGRSTRVPFPSDATLAENQFINSIEQWRQLVGVEKFVLLGHSLGAYLACAYTIQHPSRVRHLVLVDPWGFALPPSEEKLKEMLSTRAQVFWTMMSRIMPFTFVRAAGPWGPDLIKRMRKDLSKTFGNNFLDYIYHCNAQKPTGEEAFYHMQYYYGWAKRPMLSRLNHLNHNIPITVIAGSKSWMNFTTFQDDRTAEQIAAARPTSSYVGVHYVDEAGHHVHAQQPDQFNKIIKLVFKLVDSGEDLNSPSPSSSTAINH